MADQEPSPRASENQNPIVELYTNLTETTFAKSAYDPDTYMNPFNPDEIVRLKGNYSIYKKMQNDDQISVCMELKKDLVLGSGWDICWDEEEDGIDREQISDDITIALLEDPEIPFEESLKDILSSYDFGFSVTEKVFKHRDDNTLTLKFLKTRTPDSWFFHKDDYGNVIKYEQQGPSGGITIDPKNIIHYINNRAFQNPYGKSDFKTAYYAWRAKLEIIKFYAIFMEKAASPTPVAKYDKNAPQTAVDKIFEIIKKFQTRTAITIPKDIDVQFLESKNNGEVYVKSIDLFNMFIGRSLFIPDLIGLHGSKTSGGAFALGKEQMQLFYKHILRRREQLEKIINNEIIWPMVIYNYGFIDNYPKFKFKPINDDDAIEFAKTWLDAMRYKVFSPNDAEINYFRKILKFPEGEIILPEQLPANPQGQQQVQDNNQIERETPQPQKNKPKDVEPQQYASSYKPLKGDFSKKTNFKLINTQFNSYLDIIKADTAPIVKKIINDLVDQIDKKGILKNQKIEKFDSIQLRFLKDLKQIIKTQLRSSYNDQQSLAKQELFKAEFATPLPADKFLDFIETETFQYIGDWTYMITKRARIELVAAIKDGHPLSEVEGVLNQDGTEMSEQSIERYSRTKLTEVANRARVDFFNESGIVAAYQYSAILDDRTTEICAGLHGKIFNAGDEPIPPLHFNCRSILVPITKYEDFEADKTVNGQNINKFIENNIGDGFSKK